MKKPEEQQHILKRNYEITRAVKISQMMETEGYAAFKELMEEKEKEFRFQDILALNVENLEDQKGIVLGINTVMNLLLEQEIMAEQPRRNPETGEPEVMPKNKK
jgi:hypothetical protein